MIRSRNRFFASALAFAVALTVLAGCGGGAKETKPSPSTSSPTPAPSSSTPAPAPAPAGPKKGGTLRIGRPVDSVALDPHQETTSPGTWIYSNINETLIRMTPDGKFEPLLAEKWSQVDPVTWRFTLRKGIKFHDGTDFDAAAVKFSIDRIIDPQKPGRASSQLAFIKEVKVADAGTVDIITKNPYGPILNALALPYTGGIVSPAAVKKFGEDYARNPVGTGPFKFVEWKKNNETSIERFDGYWGEKALLDKVVYRVIPEESARMLALQTGEIDVVMNPAPSEIANLKKDAKFTVNEVPGVRIVYIGLNLKKAPLNDMAVRQALNMAVDRKSIVDNILEGAAVLPTSYIAPAIFGYKDVSTNWAYDVAKAEKMLDDAGWKKGADGIRAKDGKKLTFEVQSAKGRYLKDAESVEAFQAQMKKIGVDVKVTFLEWATLFTKIRSGPDHGVDAFLLGWSTASGDADYTLYPVWGSDQVPPKGWNSYNYGNKRVDELGLKAGASNNPDERKQLYGEMQEILAKESPIIPIYNVKEIVVTGKAVKGFTIHPIDYFLWWNKAWLDK